MCVASVKDRKPLQNLSAACQNTRNLSKQVYISIIVFKLQNRWLILGECVTENELIGKLLDPMVLEVNLR